MALNATIIRGSKRIAMIDGRIYEPGDAIRGPDGTATPFRLAEVDTMKVVLTSESGRYPLSYSNTLASQPPASAKVRASADNPNADPSDPVSSGEAPDGLRSLLGSPLTRALLDQLGGGGALGGRRRGAAAPEDDEP
jgi:hypothetical protein